MHAAKFQNFEVVGMSERSKNGKNNWRCLRQERELGAPGRIELACVTLALRDWAWKIMSSRSALATFIERSCFKREAGWGRGRWPR